MPTQPFPHRALPRLFTRLTPPQTLVASFLGMILIGALLLCLPAASRSGQSVGFLNALFTATSANCVTGLVVVNTLEHWTVFGKAVILALIQLGGLGLVAVLTISMVVLRRRISLRSRRVIQASFNQESVGGMVRLVRMVILTTAVFEGAGAALLTIGFYTWPPGGVPLGFGQALGKGIFHAISAFCNAGFDVLGPYSLMPYAANPFILITIMVLIVAGGLGFIVWAELLSRPKREDPIKKHWRLRTQLRHLSLHTKLALSITGALIAAGVGLFLLLEWDNPGTMGGMPPGQKALAALFQSVTLRTCGFDAIGQGELTDTSKAVSCLFMLVGGSPAGTAGGFKTVTLGVILASMLSALRGRNSIEAAGRTLPLEMLQKSLTVVSLLLATTFLSTLLLHFTEAGSPFPHTIIDLFFESASATGTVGLSTGITPYLSSAGKGVLSACMFIGRLSPVTVAVALSMRYSRMGGQYAYPAERVIIG